MHGWLRTLMLISINWMLRLCAESEPRNLLGTK